MDESDLHLKEYERALTLLDSRERNLDRLALYRTIFLVLSVMFLWAYLKDLEGIRLLRLNFANISQDEQELTVLDYLLAHERIENETIGPDELGRALIQLVPRIGEFLGENLTVENQSAQPVSAILEKAKAKPERIRLENPYLPKLSIPVSYTMLALLSSWLMIASFYYFSYRRSEINVLYRYLSYHVHRLDELVGTEKDHRPLAKPGLTLRGLSTRGSSVPSSEAGTKEVEREVGIRTKVLSTFESFLARSIANSGRSPFRLLNSLLTVALFVSLLAISCAIKIGEKSKFVPHWYLVLGLAAVIMLPPAFAFHKLNLFFLSKHSHADLRFLADTGDFF